MTWPNIISFFLYCILMHILATKTFLVVSFLMSMVTKLIMKPIELSIKNSRDVHDKRAFNQECLGENLAIL